MLIITSADLVGTISGLMPELPLENVIGEPNARNTAAAIGLAAVAALKKDPNAILAVMPSDHFISDEESFVRICHSAIRYAERGLIVTLGITPTRPETGYGYIRFSDFIEDMEEPLEVEHQARHMDAFVEKPNVETALGYLKEGRYLWNSGMFFFQARTILEEMARYLPDVYEGMRTIAEAWGTPEGEAVLADVYSNVQSISIDYGVMEKTEKLVVIPASMGWSDVGSWEVLGDWQEEGSDNMELGNVIAIEANNNVLCADEGHMVAAIGVQDLVVAVSNGAVLVCPKERSQDVRRVVDELRKRNHSDFL